MTKGHVWLIDSSALIRIKRVTQQEQWGMLKQMEAMVVAGELAFPRQIKVEVTEVMHPDAPGIWAAGVFESTPHPKSPDYAFLSQVMSCPAKDVVDPTKQKEDGDPWLLAQALELCAAGYNVTVVTEDQKDNPTRIAVTTACGHLGLNHCSLADFMAACGMKGTIKKDQDQTV